MPLSRDDQKQAMRAAIQFGDTAGILADEFKWLRLTSEEVQVVNVLRASSRLVSGARDTLDVMEENDE